jgi:hypothetical protein
MKMTEMGGSALIAALQRSVWEICRLDLSFRRRFGIAGYLVPVCLIVSCFSLLLQHSMIQSEQRYRHPSTLLKPPQKDEGYQSDARVRMAAFEQHLLPHEQIPDVIQALLDLADTEHLAISRGEYKSFVDVEGQFLRYRVTMPVKGNSQAIYRFIKEALHTQGSLALESVQFKRERIQASEMDVRIQWVILARLPDKAIKTTRGFE